MSCESRWSCIHSAGSGKHGPHKHTTLITRWSDILAAIVRSAARVDLQAEAGSERPGGAVAAEYGAAGADPVAAAPAAGRAALELRSLIALSFSLPVAAPDEQTCKKFRPQNRDGSNDLRRSCVGKKLWGIQGNLHGCHWNLLTRAIAEHRGVFSERRDCAGASHSDSSGINATG